MSSDNVAVSKMVEKNENKAVGGRKTTSVKPPEQGLKCPRCDSGNTKFCYYNNYSLTQPRHFCKTCRRYWTKGGALRSVPVGGGCRKNQKGKSSSRMSSGLDSKESASCSELGGMKFFNGFPTAMDFQLKGLPNFHHPRRLPADDVVYTQFSNAGDMNVSDTSAAGSSNSLMGFPHSFSSMNNSRPSLASSIESLSSINQDLHRKIQQQRLSFLFGGDNRKEYNNNVFISTTSPFEIQTQRPQPTLFQNLEISIPDQINSLGNSTCKQGDTATEWFFGNTFAPATPTVTTANGSGYNDVIDNTSNWNGAEGWGGLHQPFGTLMP